MSFKAGFLLIALLAGSYAFPVEDGEQDTSIFFDHTDSSQRVVGGTVADRIPYMVAISSGLIFRGLICGGSLVTTRHVLTAAHCISAVIVDGFLTPSLRIAVGTNRWNTGGTLYRISGNITHADYDADLIKNDIGLLITENNVVLTNIVSLVTLNFNFVEPGVPTTAAGWGITRSLGSVSPVLMELSASIVEGSRCVREVEQRALEVNMVGVPPVHPDVEICAFAEEGRGMCSGDSGSALMRSDTNQQIGIVSWGIPCARGAPDMFVRLSAFRSWVLDNLSQTL